MKIARMTIVALVAVLAPLVASPPALASPTPESAVAAVVVTTPLVARPQGWLCRVLGLNCN